jgi:hypothetical protein
MTFRDEMYSKQFVMNSSSLMKGLEQCIVSAKAGALKAAIDVRFGSKADMCSAKGHVR